jgi:hypothetical protein
MAAAGPSLARRVSRIRHHFVSGAGPGSRPGSPPRHGHGLPIRASLSSPALTAWASLITLGPVPTADTSLSESRTVGPESRAQRARAASESG